MQKNIYFALLLTGCGLGDALAGAGELTKLDVLGEHWVSDSGDTGADWEGPCARVVDHLPEDRGTWAHDEPLSFLLSTADYTAEVWVWDESEYSVDGVTVWDEREATLYFSSENLEPDHWYVVEVYTCGWTAEKVVRFRTEP